jgi:YD repeat-containing protein
MPSASQVRRSALVSTLGLVLLFVAFSLGLADVTYQYDKDGRLTQVCNPSGQGAKYIYDSDGNITNITPTPCATPTATATP